ncbi:hypothetical protein Drorol1_Dr00003620 [Drosera rotundifolia]
MKLEAEYVPSSDRNYSHYDYNVTIDNHRIFALADVCDKTANKWLDHILRSHRPGTGGPLLVGISVERNPSYDSYDNLTIVCGSNCLILDIDPTNSTISRALKIFFSNPNVVAVGVKIGEVANQLFKDSGIEFGRIEDVNGLAVKGLKREDLNLAKYDLDRLANIVIGDHVDVVRPTGYIEWYEKPSSRWEPCTETKVKFVTRDAYLCFAIGEKLLPVL